LRRAVVIAAVAIAACSVTRRSPGLACGSNGDCMNGRTCAMSYCVLEACPVQCNSCDLTANPPTCDIRDPGGNTTCPSGMDCTIHCTTNGACGNVDCSAAASCTITCDSSGACGNVTCGSGACDVTCSGAGACGNVACPSSCACDVSCGAGECGNINCPMDRNGSMFCTANGSNNQPCVSSQPRCGRC
jgi:hypothetical protein